MTLIAPIIIELVFLIFAPVVELHTRSDNLARSDRHGQPPVVKVFNVKSSTAERGEKVDLSVVEQVIVLALESGVGLLLNLEDDISRHNARELVTFAAELDLVAILDTAVDVNVKDLALNNGLFTVTVAAAVLLTDDLSFTVAVRADGLEALDHWAHLAHHGLHTRTVTAGT